jgi:hypothetical protein
VGLVHNAFGGKVRLENLVTALAGIGELVAGVTQRHLALGIDGLFGLKRISFEVPSTVDAGSRSVSAFILRNAVTGCNREAS